MHRYRRRFRRARATRCPGRMSASVRRRSGRSGGRHDAGGSVCGGAPSVRVRRPALAAAAPSIGEESSRRLSARLVKHAPYPIGPGGAGRTSLRAGAGMRPGAMRRPPVHHPPRLRARRNDPSAPDIGVGRRVQHARVPVGLHLRSASLACCRPAQGLSCIAPTCPTPMSTARTLSARAAQPTCISPAPCCPRAVSRPQSPSLPCLHGTIRSTLLHE
jgi:hypothetical protein